LSVAAPFMEPLRLAADCRNGAQSGRQMRPDMYDNVLYQIRDIIHPGDSGRRLKAIEPERQTVSIGVVLRPFWKAQ
jgi:hypothetical protein